MLAVGFAAGPPAEAVSAMTQEQALEKALGQLDDMFRDREWLAGGRCAGKGDWEASSGNAAPEESGTNGGEVGHAGQPNHRCAPQEELRRDGSTYSGDANNETINSGKGLGSVGDQGSSSEPDQIEPCAAAMVDGGAKKESENSAAKRGERHLEAADERVVDGDAYEGKAVEIPSTAYIGGLVHDWVRDEPFVRGGYCYPRVGFDETTHADAAASVGGSLFFAGEHTNTPTGMTVHAAIDSGER